MRGTAVSFPQRSPLNIAYGLTQRELRNQDVTPDELLWLREHPVTWLKSLGSLKAQTESHINKSRLSLVKPTPGSNPSMEYLRDKHALDQRNIARFHFLEKVIARMAEVKSLFGYDQSLHANDADFVDRVRNAVYLIEQGRAQDAALSLEALLECIEELHNT